MAGTSRRGWIIDAAIAEFAARGYYGARVDRIAGSASANKQLIFHYFGSKDGLYSTALSHMFSTAPQTGGIAPAPPEALKRDIDQLVNWFARTPGAAVAVSECAHGLDLPEPAKETVAAWRRKVSASLASTIDDGQRQGHFRDDLDAQSVVEFIVGAVVGHSLLDQPDASATRTQPTFSALLGRLIADHCAWR